MEQMRGKDSKNDFTNGQVSNKRNNRQPPTGFEGMNYEQRRAPYRGMRQNSITNQSDNQNGSMDTNGGDDR